jgi:hypothetical protein
MKAQILAIFQHLKLKIPELKRIDLYNTDQFETYEQDHPLPLPSVLVEILPITWQRTKQGIQQGKLTLRFHLGQELYSDSWQDSPSQNRALEVFDLLQRLYLALQDFAPPNCTLLERVQTNTDTQYKNCIVHITEFVCTYNDDTKAIDIDSQYQTINPDLVATPEVIITTL